MRKNERYCSFCGNIIHHNSKFCNACGAAADLIEQEYTTPTSSTSGSIGGIKDHEVLGIVSIYISVIGCFIIPIVGNIVAIIVGHISQRQGKNKYATIGLAISYSIIGLSLLIALILTLVFTIPNF